MIICVHRLGSEGYKVKVYAGADILYYDAKDVLIIPETLITNFNELVIDAEAIEVKDDRVIILRK